MPVRARLETKGFAEYLERLAQAGQDIDTIAAEALKAGGQVLLAGMLQRVPRRTGNLAAHLEVTEPKQDGNFVYIEVGMPRKDDADVARYGNVMEYGSSSTAAQPYIRPTLDSDMRAAREEMRRVFEETGVL